MELRKIRKEMRMTQKEFSEMLGLTQGYLSELETGKSPITQNILNALQDNNIDFVLEKNRNEETTIFIPVVDVQVSAGSGIMNSSELVTGSFEIGERFRHQFGRDIAIVSVSGDSMSPTICHQDWLLVHRQDDIQSEGIFVFLQDNELRVKRIQKELSGRILIISDNPKYQTEVLDNFDNSFIETKVIGKVVGIIQKA
ncbi:MAG: LexA family transcriptional regulator [Brevinemataceae bacterium]